VSQAAQTTTLVIPAMVPTLAPGRIMVPVRITAEALWWSPSEIGRTIAVADIGRATGITSGSQAIGCTEMAKGFGSAATTLCGDIDRAVFGAAIP